MSSSDSPTLQWPNHRQGSKISDPIRFEENEEGLGRHEFVEDYSHAFCKECGKLPESPVHKTIYNEEEEGARDQQKAGLMCPNCDEDEEEMVINGTNAICPTCGYALDLIRYNNLDKNESELEEEEGHYQTRPDPDNIHGCLCCDIGACQCTDCDECDPEWTGPKEEGGVRPPIDWENAKRTPSGVFIEVPNLEEGGSDYYDGETGDWVIWGLRNLRDEDIVDTLAKSEEGGAYVGEGSGGGQMGGIIYKEPEVSQSVTEDYDNEGYEGVSQTVEVRQEEATDYQAGGEDAELGQEDPNNSSTQLNPSTLQNQTSFGQGQFAPTTTISPLGKGEADGFIGYYFCPECQAKFHETQEVHDKMYGHELKEEESDTENDAPLCVTCGDSIEWADVEAHRQLGHDVQNIKTEEAEGHCDNCGGWGTGIRYSDLTNTMLCKDCRREARELDKINHSEEELYSAGEIGETDEEEICSCCDDPCECGDCELCGRYVERDEEAKDPRIEPTEDAELSPEAQKIAGTDEASQQAKESKKPKLEVDVSDKISILGKTGSGKTNLIKVLMTDILPDYTFYVLDTIGNMAEFEGNPNVKYFPVTPSDTEAVDDIIYQALEQGDCMVVIDEVDRYQTKKGTMLNELVNVGRNYNVGGIFAARRTADVDKDILSNSPFIFVFQHILPQDLDVLIDWFAQPEQTFRDLQEYEAILFKNGEQIWVGKVPEKPTTKPNKKPNLPKKPKGKSKEPDKPKEPEGDEGEGQEPEEDPKEKGTPKKPIEKEPSEPEESEPEEPTHEFESKSETTNGDCSKCGGTMYQGTCVNCGDVPSKASASALTSHSPVAAGPPPQVLSEEQEANEIHEEKGSKAFREQVLKEEGAFTCMYDNKKFKWEKDFEDHVNSHVR